jgi:hypothetical protein
MSANTERSSSKRLPRHYTTLTGTITQQSGCGGVNYGMAMANKRKVIRLTSFEYVALLMIVALGGLYGYAHFFIRARIGPPPGYSPCINNLRQLDGAIESWASEHHRAPGDPVIKSEVVTYIKGGLRLCPQGGEYNFGKVGEHPTCSYPTHTNFFPDPPQLAAPDR